jgi:hypothetical protein
LTSYVNFFTSYKNPNEADQESLQALTVRWYSIYLVMHAIEFLCLSAAKLMVLDRMSVFAAPQAEGSAAQRRWTAAGRVVMAAVVLGNAVGLAASVASAVHYQEDQSDNSAYYAVSVQSFCEVAVLLLIVLAFVVVGVLSARRVSSMLLAVGAASSAAATGRALRLQMAGTTAFVFVAFLLRSVLATLLAVAQKLRDFHRDLDVACPGIDKSTYCDATCYNQYTHILGWMFYTPEFQSTITLISSPVALLVALWGMTSKATLQLMKLSEQESSVTPMVMPTTMMTTNKREKARVPQNVLGE